MSHGALCPKRKNGLSAKKRDAKWENRRAESSEAKSGGVFAMVVNAIFPTTNFRDSVDSLQEKNFSRQKGGADTSLLFPFGGCVRGLRGWSANVAFLLEPKCFSRKRQGTPTILPRSQNRSDSPYWVLRLVRTLMENDAPAPRLEIPSPREAGMQGT